MARRNVKVLDLDASDLAIRAYGPLLRAKGVSKRAETRIARRIRNAIREALLEAIRAAYIDGSAPYRTGRGKRALLNGVRSFGTTFGTLRGHVLGPAYIAAHETGAMIKPINARALAIPLPAALRPDGTPKLPGPRSWRNVIRTFIYKSKRTGKAYIAYKGSSDRLTLLYVLVDEAQLSRHEGFLSTSWERRGKPALLEAVGEAMMYELGNVDLLSLARVTYKGRGKPRRK